MTDMNNDTPSPAPGNPQPPEKPASAFARVAAYARENKMEAVAIGTAALLGTTALTTPLMATTLGALGLMAGSFYLLLKTSDVVVNNASAIGKKMGIPPLLLGLGLGAITSLPELFVSVGAAMNGTPELGIGNIVGSNIANILLILGATAAIRPIISKGLSWKFNTLAMAGATVAMGVGLAAGVLSPIAGIGLLALAGAYMCGCYKAEKADELRERVKAQVMPEPAEQKIPEATAQTSIDKLPTWLNALWGAAGVGGLIASADLLINSATVSATTLGVSPALVGALAIAIGTSLPELAVNIKAALKGETAMAVGNILGSNIFNVLMVGGAVGLAGAAVPPEFGPGTAYGLLNMTAFGGSAALLTAALLKGKGSLQRWHGWAGLGLYAAFTGASVMMAGGAAAPADEAKVITPPEPAPAVQVQKQALVPQAVPFRDYSNALRPL
jgi:cation:H+ antiporter